MPSLDELLLATSRTFAAAIPLLPEPTRGAVRTAYLLFRIADTFEDAAAWPRERRIAALTELERIVEEGDVAAAREAGPRWAEGAPTAHAGYLALLRATDDVVADFAALSPGARAIVARHTLRTVQGMGRVVEHSDELGRVQLTSVEEVRAYCYVVAGIVGELLTDLFVHDIASLAAEKEELEATQVAFGEGLQLVNVLKDVDDDAAEGRTFVPAGTRDQLMALARADLRLSERYVGALVRGGAPRGVVAFCAMPLLLARATLDRVEAEGPGAKVGRALVGAVLQHVADAPLDDGGVQLLRFGT
jgi:farnesyl-diphosphate farnesyltransferase